MALQRYRRKYWFPSGAVAASIPARVFLYDDNVFAPLFTDGTGGTPLPNPTNTDGAGFLEFWAEEGQYWVHIDSEAVLIDVGLSEEQADLTTGVATGGEMSINAGDPQAVDIAALVGYVVDNNELTSTEPSPVKVDEAAQTVVLDGPAQARALTHWLMDSTGSVVQQANPPTPAQRRTHLQLGVSLYDPGLGSLVEVQTLQTILGQPGNQLADLMDAQGPFTLTGNVITAVPGTLSFNKSAGTLFARGLNHYAGGVLTDSPHVSPSPLLAPALFKRVIRFPEAPLPPDVTTIDPTLYDVGGVAVPVGGSSTTTTVQRVYVTPNSSPSAQVAVQYGQTTYATLQSAIQAVGTEPFEPNPVAGFGALVAYIAVTRTATNLADPLQAAIIRPATKLPA